MPLTVTLNTNINSHICPHGVLKSACPICSKQNASVSMSNSSSIKKSNNQDWSYQKCYAAGLQIKAIKQRHIDNRSFLEKQFQLSLNISRNIQNVFLKLNALTKNIKFKTLQSSLQNLVKISSQTLLFISNQYTKLIHFAFDIQKKVSEMLFQANEKLVNILGEIKNFVDRKIADDMKKKAKKFLLFFLSNIEDENYQNDETLAIFKARELRKYIMKFYIYDKNK